MGKYINKKTVVDEETGEIIKQINWFGYDGFSEKGYRYRKNSEYIRYYFDAIPSDLTKDSLFLLFMLSEIMNEENVLVYRVKRKSKFSNIIYKPYDKDELRDKVNANGRPNCNYGINKFYKCWNELRKHCIKKVEYRTCKAWAINPAFISKCKQLPYWLYDEFQQYINPYLSANAINKFKTKLNEIKYGD